MKLGEIEMKKIGMITLLLLLMSSGVIMAQDYPGYTKQDRNDYITIWGGGGFSIVADWSSSSINSAYAGDGNIWPDLESDEVFLQYERSTGFLGTPLTGGVEIHKGYIYLMGEYRFGNLSVVNAVEGTAGFAYNGTAWYEENSSSSEEFDASTTMINVVGGINLDKFSIFAGILDFSTDLEINSNLYSLENVGFSGIGGGVAFSNYDSKSMFIKGSAAFYLDSGWVKPELTSLTTTGAYDEFGFSYNRDESFYSYALAANLEVGYFITSNLFISVNLSVMVLYDGLGDDMVEDQVVNFGTQYSMVVSEDLSYHNNSIIAKIGLILF